MYGTCETLCRLLSELYPAETPLNLIVWSPADIEALADGMEYAVSEQDTREVLAGSEMKRLYVVGSENGGDGDAFVREEREAMDVVLQALDGEKM